VVCFLGILLDYVWNTNHTKSDSMSSSVKTGGGAPFLAKLELY